MMRQLVAVVLVAVMVIGVMAGVAYADWIEIGGELQPGEEHYYGPIYVEDGGSILVDMMDLTGPVVVQIWCPICGQVLSWEFIEAYPYLFRELLEGLYYLTVHNFSEDLRMYTGTVSSIQ